MLVTINDVWRLLKRVDKKLDILLQSTLEEQDLKELARQLDESADALNKATGEAGDVAKP